LTYFCTQCWKEISESAKLCPHCGADQRKLGREPFVTKLIRALGHPEPETPTRAAYLLGELRAKEAVPELMQLIALSQHPQLRAAAIRALGKIDSALLSEISALWRSSELSVFERAALGEALGYTSPKRSPEVKK
jgi:HEAT repeat protein